MLLSLSQAILIVRPPLDIQKRCADSFLHVLGFVEVFWDPSEWKRHAKSMMNKEKTPRLIHYRTNKVWKGMPQKITLTGTFLEDKSWKCCHGRIEIELLVRFWELMEKMVVQHKMNCNKMWTLLVFNVVNIIHYHLRQAVCFERTCRCMCSLLLHLRLDSSMIKISWLNYNLTAFTYTINIQYHLLGTPPPSWLQA